MPKISTKYLRINQGDLDHSCNFPISYTTGEGFYGELPAEFNDSFDALNDDELAALSASKKYARKYRPEAGHKKIVSGKDEEDVAKNMHTLIKKLLTLSLVKVPVILVKFDNNSDDDEDPDPQELKNVGLDFAATYGFEVTTPGKKIYYKYIEYEFFEEMKTRREEIHIHRNDTVSVIPDTPENRQFVEDLHAALKILVKKLVDFTATPEDMVKAIQARQKLLN